MIQRICDRFLDFKLNTTAQYLLLTVITLIAVALRFYKLGEWSFWGDEIITVERLQNVSNLIFAKDPLSMILTQIAITTFGTSEWSARLVPALVGTAAVPVLYFPVRRMLDPATALIAGLLLAVSPWHLYWSQNARFYTMLFLLYTLALLTFYFGIEEDRPWYLLISLFLLGLATLERLIAVFFVPVVVVYLAFLIIMPFERPAGLRLRNILLFFLPGVIPGFVLVLPYLQQPSRWFASFGWVNNNPVWILAGVTFYIGIATICMAVLGALYLLTKKNRVALLLSIGAVVPLLAIMALSLVQYSANRYVFISLMSWIILASVAVRELLLHTDKSARLLAVGALAILLLLPLSENMLYYKYQNGNRDDWKAAFEFIQEQRQEGDLIMPSDPDLANYYLKEKTTGIWEVGNLDLARIRKDGHRIWFVEDMNTAAVSEIHNWLVENTQLVANFDVHVRARNFKMRVYLYSPNDLPVSQVSR